ncbi:hypothetical protein UFOVP453_28 [uncultured Caudovirales phage]|uniref:Uncharacterized protein n=1 Tax=uncultured Caudovirales phage TaxID=2100421 RepID=A0A6J5MEK6_9CAUD|nr:hypothetical protein UFOVP453_28 [uncultured Caudovirales phage]
MKLCNIEITETLETFMSRLTIAQRMKLIAHVNERIAEMNACAGNSESYINRYTIPGGTLTIDVTHGDTINSFRIDYERETQYAELLHSLRMSRFNLESFYEKLERVSLDNREIALKNWNQITDEYSDARGMTIDGTIHGITDVIDLLRNLAIMLDNDADESIKRAAERREEMFIARIDTKIKRSESQ